MGNIRTKGAEHSDTFNAQHELATYLLRMGEYDEARDLARQAANNLRSLLGEGHPQTLHATYNYGRILTEVGELAPSSSKRLLREGEDVLRSLVSQLIRQHGPESHQRQATRIVLGRNLLAQGRLAEAEQLIVDAVRALKDKFAPACVRLLTPLRLLSEIRLRRNKGEEARAAASEAIALCRNVAAQASVLPKIFELQGRALAQLERFAEAERAYKQGIEVLGTLDKRDPELERSLSKRLTEVDDAQ